MIVSLFVEHMISISELELCVTRVGVSINCLKLYEPNKTYNLESSDVCTRVARHRRGAKSVRRRVSRLL